MILDIIDIKLMIGIGCAIAAMILILWRLAKKVNEIKNKIKKGKRR